MGGSSAQSNLRGREKAGFAPRGGRENLGAARAAAEGAGRVAAVAQRRKRAEAETKLRCLRFAQPALFGGAGAACVAKRCDSVAFGVGDFEKSTGRL